MILEITDLGTLDYAQAHALQRELVERKKASPAIPDSLLLVEHPAVYTAGRGASIPPGVGPVVPIERGGKLTYHNPGQLVAYPIVSLKRRGLDVHAFMRGLERTLIANLGEYGVAADTREGLTGVWVTGKPKKIASIGIAVSGWVSYHGCALNVSNDLGGFRRIDPCGLSFEVMTSLAEQLGERCVPLERVKEDFARAFVLELGYSESYLAGERSLVGSGR